MEDVVLLSEGLTGPLATSRGRLKELLRNFLVISSATWPEDAAKSLQVPRGRLEAPQAHPGDLEKRPRGSTEAPKGPLPTLSLLVSMVINSQLDFTKPIITEPTTTKTGSAECAERSDKSKSLRTPEGTKTSRALTALLMWGND